MRLFRVNPTVTVTYVRYQKCGGVLYTRSADVKDLATAYEYATAIFHDIVSAVYTDTDGKQIVLV